MEDNGCVYMTTEMEKDDTLHTFEVTQEEFIEYEKVRQSGVCNMFDIDTVSDLSGLTKKQIKYIMTNYDKLNKAWPNVRSTEYPRRIGLVNLDKRLGE